MKEQHAALEQQVADPCCRPMLETKSDASAPKERQSTFGVCAKGHIWQGSLISALPCKDIELLFCLLGGATLSTPPRIDTLAYRAITDYSSTTSAAKEGIVKGRHPFHRKEHIKII